MKIEMNEKQKYVNKPGGVSRTHMQKTARGWKRTWWVLSRMNIEKDAYTRRINSAIHPGSATMDGYEISEA